MSYKEDLWMLATTALSGMQTDKQAVYTLLRWLQAAISAPRSWCLSNRIPNVSTTNHYIIYISNVYTSQNVYTLTTKQAVFECTNVYILTAKQAVFECTNECGIECANECVMSVELSVQMNVQMSVKCM